eukprot:1196401-Prorocentrum_minimum.AAC.12
MSYYLSMLLGLSGITTIFFCGIMDAHYTWNAKIGRTVLRVRRYPLANPAAAVTVVWRRGAAGFCAWG